MAKQLQLRRGTTAANDLFTGANGEVTVDTNNHSLRVHDGSTQGGYKVGGEDYVTSYQTPSSSNNYTWYRKYKSGWVEQGGIGTSHFTVVFPITMADTNYTITTGNNHYSDNAGTPVSVYFNKATTGFSLQGRWNGAAQSGIEMCWEVKGMAA